MEDIFTKLSAYGKIKYISIAFLKAVFFMFLAGVNVKGYAQPTVLGTEIVNGSYATYNLNTVGGFKQYRIQALNNAVASALKWEFAIGTAASTDYSITWRPYTLGQTLSGYNTFIDPATATASARYNSSGGKGGLLPVVTAANYYTFNITNSNQPSNNNMEVLETSYSPATISTVIRTPATVGAVVSPVITVTMSSAPATGENVFVRYSTSSTFATSTLVQLSFVGATGTATIPAQAATTIIYYYVYSSNKTLAQINTDVSTYGQSAHDMATLNLNNNAGANYIYTVLPVTVTATNSVNNASYSTLAAAFTAISTGIHTGIDTVWVGGNTTETSSAVLGASGVGGANYTSLLVKPAGLRNVTGNLAAPLVDLNGADNVTIDGLNDGTNTLTLTNANAGSAAGTSTIRLYNAATVNTVQNCIIEGSTISAADGILTLGTGANTTISISNNTIRPAGANLPIYAVNSSQSGTNTSVTISGNNIQDYFSATVNSSGIYASTNVNAWTISSNKFYQTSLRTISGAAINARAIWIIAGGGHTISGNTIGFANSSGTGNTSYTTTNTSNQVIAIELGGNATISSIQGNLIGGIVLISGSNITATAPGIFSGIYLSSGAANIASNAIGSSAGTSSISITCSVTAVQLFITGIYAASASPNIINIQNNSIGAVNLISNTATVQFNAFGIYVPGAVTGTFSIADNNIGSTSTAYSLRVGTGGTAATNFTAISTGATGSVSITGNNIQNCSTQGTGASSFTGISNTGNNAALAVAITNNNVISCKNAGTNGFAAINNNNTGTATTINMSGNIIRSDSITAASGSFTAIANAGLASSAITINNNQLGNASGGLILFTAASTANVTGIINSAASSTAAVLTIQSNDFRGITNTIQGSGNNTYIINTATTLSQNISTNTFTALSINTTGNVTFISNSVSLGSTGSKTVNDNAIVTSFTKSGGGANLYFYYDAGNSVAGSMITNDGNNFSNVTLNGAIPVQGWFNTDGSGTVPVKNITNNTFNNITANNSGVFLLQITNGTGNISNNTITGSSSPGTLTALTVTSGSFNIFSNTINSLSTSSSSSPITGINITGGTTHNIYYHTIYNLTSTATSTIISAIAVSGGTTVKVYKNKIYGLSNSSNLVSGGVYGINATGGTTVSVYNNLIGALTTPNANFDDAIRGISLTGGTNLNIYYNTVHLTASSAGASFGSSALYAGTGPTLDLRNNILSNISVPGTGAAGKTVAYRRNGTSLASYANSSDNNLFYAGTPGTKNFIFYDGTNSDQTLAAYKTRVAIPRDTTSVSASLTFISTTGSSSNFLHLNAASVAESGAETIAGFTDDYDDEVRFGNAGYAGTGTRADIGADEFQSVACPAAPVITGISPYYPAPYYAGDVISIRGSNLGGITYATINNVNATIVSTGNISLGVDSANLIIPSISDSVGIIEVAYTSSCAYSNIFNFVFAGYITKGSQGAINWNTNTKWRNNLLPVNNAPATINTGDFVTLDVSADPNKFTILTGGSLIHQNNSLIFGATYLNNTLINGTLTIDNSGSPVLNNTNRFISPKLVVASGGLFTNNSAIATAVSIANFYVNAGGAYTHNATGSTAAGIVNDFPGSSSRSFGNTSNVIITKWANGNSSPVNLPASGTPGWGNLTINVATLAGSWNQIGTLTKVQGNLIIQATGGGANEFRLVSNTGSITTNISGSLTISGGIFTATDGSSSITLTVGIDMTVSGGTFYGNTSTGSSTITVTGNVLLSSGLIRGRSGSGAYSLTVGGNMTVTGTYTPATSSGAATTTVAGAFTVNNGTVTSPGSSYVYTYTLGSLTVTGTAPNGTFGLSSSSGSTITITTGSVSITGDGSVTSTSAGTVTINCTGNFSCNSTGASAPAGAAVANSQFAFQNGSGNPLTLNLGGNFSVTNTGLFVGGKSSSPAVINFTGGAASVTYTANPSLMVTVMAGGINIHNDFYVFSGKTVTLNSSILPPSTSNFNDWTFTVNTGGTLDCGLYEIGTNAGTPRTQFILQTGATIKTANPGGIFGTALGTASITGTTALTSFSSGATYVFNGSSAQVTSAFTTTPTASTVANMIIDNTAGVTLSASYTVSIALQMLNTAGVVTLGAYNLTTAAITVSGAGFSGTKMVNTNGTGALGLPVATTPSTVFFPVGNGSDYTPANYNFSSNSNLRYLYVRAVKPRNPNDFSATNYINNRWWNTDLSLTTGTYAYTASYTYISGDVIGSAAAIRLNRWTGSAWVEDAASSVNTGTLTLNSGPLNQTPASGSLAATAQWVGRVYVAPAVYHWTNTVNGLWTDLTKWTPNGVPASGDGVIFDATGGSVYTVTNMPTGITLTQFTVSNNNIFDVKAGTTSGTVTTNQFNVAAGSSMTIDGTTVVNFNLPAGVTATVAGSLNLKQATHTVTVASANGLLFQSGGYFSYGGLSPLLGFSGNPFGTTGTTGAVLFQNGSVCECFEGSNPFGATAADKITTFQGGSLFRYSDPLAASLPSASGRTYANFTYNANKISNMAAAAQSFICDTLSVTQGTINFNLQGTPTPDHAVKGNINVATGTTLSFTPGAAGTVNMNSGTTQKIWGGGTFNVNALATFDINTATTASLEKNMSAVGTGNVQINGTLICTAENNISSSGTVSLNNGGTISIQSINGISTGGIGNIRTTTFTRNAGGNFTYSGIINQATGNLLPLTLSGAPLSVLTIANTGTAPNNVVTLTTNNTQTARINLNAGQFNAGTGGTLIIDGGTNLVAGGGGNQFLSGGANDNIIRFATNGAVSGIPELWNVTVGTSGTGVDFQNNARINGILLINSGGFVVNNAPKYNTGSYLIYNTGGSYNRNIEWNNNSGLGTPGYPHHVTIQNATTLDILNPAYNIGCGGDLNLGTATAGTLFLSSYVQPYDLFVGGNINIGGSPGTGTLTMSNSIGCDLFLTGNWTRNANGIVNFGGGNGRSVYFEGATDAVITASGGQMFPYFRMQKATKTTRVTLADPVSIKWEVTFTKGTLDLGINNKFFTILSDVLGDGRVDVSDPNNTDFIYGADDRFGQFIVQRYMPARRSWRLLAAPLSGIGTHSVSEAWQERGRPVYTNGLDYTSANWSASVAADSISNNFGTQITGGLASDGFDQSPNNNPSIKLYSGGAWMGPSLPVNNVPVRSQEGWMLFVRGDRKSFGEITNQYKTPTITTLRPRGRIFIGSKVLISSGITVVGNPYASAVDYFAMSRTGGSWPANPTYYMWDPYIGGTYGAGGFVTLTWNGTDFTRNIPSSIDNRYIPSGAAIMVDFPAGGTSQIQINEANKNTDSTTKAFRPAVLQQMSTVLNTVNADNSTYVSDGTLSMFDRSFNNEADLNDPRKLTNFNENFALQRSGKLLSIERMKPLQDGDTIFYNIQKMRTKKYQLQFITHNLEVPASLTAFLEDQYLKTKTPVSLQDTTRIDFRIDSNKEAAADRFRLVFRNAAKYTAVNAFVLNSDIAVNWQVADEFNIKEYIIERSFDGNTFVAEGSVASGGNSDAAVNYKWTDASPKPGEYFYRIKAVSNNGATAYSGVIKVAIAKGSPDLYVFPNPLSGNTIQLQMNDKPAGQYGIRLMNSAGQFLFGKIIDHAGGTDTKKIEAEQVLMNGVYNLEVTTPAKTITVIKVVVNR